MPASLRKRPALARAELPVCLVQLVRRGGARVIDELSLDIAPVLLGSGERIFDGVESFDFEPVEVLHSPLTTHIRYRRIS